MGLMHFLQYNNAVPIAIGFLFLGAGGVFAATNPESIYNTSAEVVSIDNTYIANKDLSSYTPTIQIQSVTEDTENYYIAYTLTTIDIVDATWRDVTKEKTMTVARGALGEYQDLGVYVTEQLRQVVDHEIAYLTEVQSIERKNVTNKIVATAYSGLIGAMLDTSTEVIPGYVPLVAPPEIIIPIDTPVGSDPSSPDQAGSPSPNQPSVSTPSNHITIQVLGENPSRIEQGSSYTDLGIVVTGAAGTPTIHTYVNDAEQSGAITLDTSKAGEWHILYVVSDQNGAARSAERVVIVFESAPTPTPPVSAPTTTPQTTPTSTPAVEAESEPVVPEAPPTEAETEPAPEAPATTTEQAQ